MTDLEALVIEWRDARQAVFDVQWGSFRDLTPDKLVIWTRLGHAEAALMARARSIVPPPPNPECEYCKKRHNPQLACPEYAATRTLPSGARETVTIDGAIYDRLLDPAAGQGESQ